MGAQFAGGCAGLAWPPCWVARGWPIRRCPTWRRCPARRASRAAFAAELTISFGVMLLVLTASNDARLAPYTGLLVGGLIFTCITVEAPLSGMSMNPARTFAPALVGGVTTPLWIYFLAPPIGMLAASEVYLRTHGLAAVRCAKLRHPDGRRVHLPLRRGRLLRAEPPRLSAASKPANAEITTGARVMAPTRPTEPPPATWLHNPRRGRPVELPTAGRHALRRHHHRNGRRRRHARLRARPDRQAHPAPRARRLRAPREGQLEHAQPSTSRPKYNTKDVWHDREGQAAAPAHELLRRRQHQVLRRGAASACAREDFGELRHHGGLSPAWPIELRRARAVLHARPSASITCTATAAKTRPSRPRARPYPHPAVSATSRAFSSSATTSRPRGCSRSTCRSASCSTRQTRATSPCIRCDTCDGYACLVNAKSRRPGRAASIRRCAIPNVTLRHQRLCRRVSRRARRAARSRGCVVERNGAAERYTADVVVVVVRRDQLGGAAAAIGQRPAPARAGQRLRRRRPPLHGPRQLGADGDLEVPEPDRVPEDARAERLLLRRRRLASTRWGTSPSSASSTA